MTQHAWKRPVRGLVASVVVAAAIASGAGAVEAASSPQPPRVAGTASSLVRYGYFTTGEFFPVELRRVSDFPLGFAEFDPGKDFGIVFVGAIEAPGRADFTVKGVLRREDGSALDSFVELKKYNEHASWFPIRRVFAMERLRGERRGKWELELFVDDRPVGKFPFDVLADPLWAQRPKKDATAVAQAPTAPRPVQPAPGQPAMVKLELVGPPSAQVRIDGGREQTLDSRGRLEVTLAPGTHRLEVTAPGYKPFAGDVTFAPDQPAVRHPLALAELPPPTVALVSPVAGSTPVREEHVKLRVEVRGESRPSALRLVKDGKVLQEVRAPSNVAPNRPWVAEPSVSGLVEGDNRITLEAVDEFGRKSSQVVSVARERLIAVELKVEPDAKVLISAPDFPKKDFTADRSGKIALRLLPGQYQLEASKPGFKPTTDRLVVNRGTPSLSHAIALGKVPPPSIAVLDPKPGTAVQVEQVNLKVELKSTEPLAQLKVSVGGARAQTFDREKRAPAGETWVVAVPVKLTVGVNQISLEASDAAGLVSVATVTLTREELIALELIGPAGAEVQLNQSRYTLDSRGIASITVRPGTYDIQATKDGFDPLKGKVTVNPGQRTAQHRLGMQIAKVAPPPAPAPAPPVVAQPAPPPAVPPKVQFSYPSADAKVERDKVPVIALVTDEVGITRLRLTVNGEPVPGVQAPADQSATVEIETPVPLQMGENVLTITATNKASKTAQVIRKVHREPPKIAAPATPPPAPAPKGERIAVVIGVGVYDNPQIPRLRFAENDARGFYDLLTSRAGFKKDNVLLVTDTAAQKPTLSNIKRALGEWLYKKAGKEDTVFVFYAGHGAPEVDAGGNERDGLSKYLIPRDADPESLFVTAFAMDDIETIFRRTQAERVVFMIDTCFSGAAGSGGRTFRRQTTRAGQLTGEFLERLSRSKGRVVISAAGPNELALELPELKHGLFTYYLIKGLEGEADRDEDNIVTINELFDYVQRNVSKRAREEAGKQTPVMSGAIQDLPLVELGAPAIR